MTLATQTKALIDAGRLFHQRGWVPATGGNFSARLAPQKMLITASGCHKGELGAQDFLLADLNGKPMGKTLRKTSYETGLHTQLYRHDAAIGAVLHTHSIANTVLSQRQAIVLGGYELLKLLPGVTTHEVQVRIPVFANDQDIARLAAAVDAHMQIHANTPAYVIRGHGLYAWGRDVAQARWRVEALEFMFECELHRKE